MATKNKILETSGTSAPFKKNGVKVPYSKCAQCGKDLEGTYFVTDRKCETCSQGDRERRTMNARLEKTSFEQRCKGCGFALVKAELERGYCDDCKREPVEHKYAIQIILKSIIHPSRFAGDVEKEVLKRLLKSDIISETDQCIVTVYPKSERRRR